MCRSEPCPPARAPAMPSHQLGQPMRPRLPRKLAASARINLNKYWHVLEELMPARRVVDEADNNAINENLDNERRLAALQLCGSRVLSNEQLAGSRLLSTLPGPPQDERSLAALHSSRSTAPPASSDNKLLSGSTALPDHLISSGLTTEVVEDSSISMTVDSPPHSVPSSSTSGKSPSR